MTCDELVRAIDAYLDDELPIIDILRVHGHLVSCERCHRVMGSEATLHALLSSDAARDEAPESLRERILRRVAAEAVERSGTPTEARSRPGAFASFSALVVAALLIGLLLMGPWTPRSREPADLVPLAAEVAAKHLLYASAQGPGLEMTTSDASEMARWLERRAGWSLKLPRLDRTDGRLIGARVSSLADNAAVYLLYEWGGRHLSLFVTGANRGGAEKAVDDVSLHTAALRGVALAWWEEEDEGLLYAAASTGDLGALREFAFLCTQGAKRD